MKRSTQARLKVVIYSLWEKGYRVTPIKVYIARNELNLDDLSVEELTQFVEAKTPEQWQELVAIAPPRSSWNNPEAKNIHVPKIFADRLLQLAREWDANGSGQFDQLTARPHASRSWHGVGEAALSRLKDAVKSVWDKGYRSTAIKSYITRYKLDIEDLSVEDLTRLIQEKTPEQWQELAAVAPPRSSWRNRDTKTIYIPKVFADRLLQVAREWDANTSPDQTTHTPQQ